MIAGQVGSRRLRKCLEWLSIAVKMPLVMLLVAASSYGQAATVPNGTRNAASNASQPTTPPTTAGATPDPTGGLTLDQFRALVAGHLSEATRSAANSRGTKSPDRAAPPDLRSADELFLQLLQVEAQDAAAHQSGDRLAGWRKSIESRFQTQNAPELDVAIIRFAEARRIAESARIESEEKLLVGQANNMLGRPATAPLTLIASNRSEDTLTALAKQHKDLLAQAEELIAKMYRSYQFSGISVTSLLEYESQVYEAETAYRQQVARDTVPQSSGPPTR